MGNFFAADNGLWSTVGKVWDVICLAVLWFICSIPIVTIGASTTALCYVCLKMARNEEGYITKQFFHSFKENFKQSTLMWLIMLVIGLVLGFNLWFYYNSQLEVKNMMMIIMMIFVWVYLMVWQYLFAALAQFENTTKNLLLFSFSVSIKKLGWTLLMVLVELLVIAVGVFFFVPVLFIAVGIIGITNAFILNHVFKPYIEQMTLESNLENNSESQSV